ncbi:MAG: GxxExxY protein [Sedimentisphaerales bacterium]|nr:GxxExxY protein [Sedimentisphaerales bacterium]
MEYKGIKFQEGFRADLIVEDKVIVELKSVENVTGAHKKQVQTYLKLTGQKLGFLLNFNTELIKDGITRVVNGLEE